MGTKIDRAELKKLVGEVLDSQIKATKGKPDPKKVKSLVTLALSKKSLKAKRADVRRLVEAEIREKVPPYRFVAHLRYARISPRKMRYVVDAVRDKDVNTADSVVKHTARRGAYFTKKLLGSALGNATDLARLNDIDLDVNKLHVVDYQATPGPTLRRWRAASARRPYMIRKRTSHARIILEEREPKKREETRRKTEKKETKPAPQPQTAPPAAEAPKKEEKSGN